MWKSPTDSASASPSARCAVSAAVHTPTPGTTRSRASASAGAIPPHSSSRPATVAAARSARCRLPSTPARCQSQPGMPSSTSGAGGTRMPAGTGPGAGVPYRHSRKRHACRASAPVTFCSSTAGTSASRTRPVRGTRRPGWRRATSRSSGQRGVKVAGSSRAPSRSGTPATAHSAPGPHAVACTSPGDGTRSASVAGPCGVSATRQNAPSATRCAGSPRPRTSGPRVARTSTGRPGRHTVSATPTGPATAVMRRWRSGPRRRRGRRPARPGRRPAARCARPAGPGRRARRR